MVLMKMGVWRIVEGTEVAPDDDAVALRKYNERKDKALATIVLGVKTNLLYLLGDPKDPVQVWTLLANQFQKKSWANKLTLRRKLNGLKLKDQEPVQEYIKSMVEVFDELAVIGDAIEEEDRVVQILANLPDSYNMLVTALEANAEVPKLELVTERLLHEERKMKERAGCNNNSSNSASGSSQGMNNLGDAALLANNKFRSNQMQKLCYFCGQPGHIKAFCDELKKLKNREEEQEEKKKFAVANFSYSKSEPDYSDEECIALVSEVVDKTSDRWVIDSAAGSHMCRNKDRLENLKKLRQPKKVKVGNGQYVEAHSEGTVKLIVKSRSKTKKVKLQNVLLVPELKYNLLSVSKAAELGKSVVFNKDGCDIVDNRTHEIIGSARKMGMLYYLECEEENKESNCLRGMKKALISVQENNFQEEMMRRLDLIEEDKKNMNIRLRSVEEDKNDICNTIMDESNQNQRECTESSKERIRKLAIKEDTQTMKENTEVKVKKIEKVSTMMNRTDSQEDKQISSTKPIQICSASSLFSTSEMSITNRQCYLMGLLFKEFPVSPMTGKSSDQDLD